MEALEINPSEYHSCLKLDRGDIFSPDSWLSKSAIWELFQSSLYRWRYYPKQHETNAMRWGSLVDCLATSPSDLDQQFTVRPETYKAPASARKNAEIIDKPWSGNAKFCKNWQQEAAESGLAVVTESTLAEAKKAAEILITTHDEAADIIKNSDRQVVMLNRVKTPYSKKPINLKALADFVPKGADFLADLKTTENFSADGFAKTIGKFGYHVQASHYLEMHNLLHPENQRKRFLIIWQQSKPPYEVAVTEIPSADIVDGNVIFNHLLGRIVTAAENNYFPPLFPKTVLLGRSSSSVFSEEMEMEELPNAEVSTLTTQC